MVVEPHWTAYVQAIGTPIVALVAGAIASGIAYRQWKIAKAKVVLDLFEKRLEIYDLVIDAIHTLIAVGPSNIDHRILSPFTTGLLKAKFLFGREVHAYLDEVYDAIVELKGNSLKLKRQNTSDEFDRLGDIEDKYFRIITSFQKKFDAMVYPYMRMDEMK